MYAVLHYMSLQSTRSRARLILMVFSVIMTYLYVMQIP